MYNPPLRLETRVNNMGHSEDSVEHFNVEKMKVEICCFLM